MRHHLPNGTFRNTADIEEPKLRNPQTRLSDLVRWKLTAPNAKPLTQPVVSPDIDSFNNDQDARTKIIWVGHATVLLRHQKLTILTDPHFSDRASPVGFAGPKRSTPPALSVTQLPHIDVVVVSHDHYDHLDKQSVLEIQQRQINNPPLFVVPLKLGQWFSNLEIDNWVECDWWEQTTHMDWRFTAVPVQHFSGRSLKQNNTLWAGWVLTLPATAENESYQIFFAGDTGYSSDFKDIYDRFGAFDLSLLPIGAYEPRWFMKELHVNPEEAVKIHQDVHSKLSIAIHWGSFALTHEPMDEPPKKLAEALTKQNIGPDNFRTVKHGELVLV